MTQRIRLGISTCPNDTFAFHALINRVVDWHDLHFDVSLWDVQELNQQLAAGQFEVAKASFHAALLLAETTVVLPAGSALGFGVGPLLLSGQDHRLPTDKFFDAAGNPTAPVVLCPGHQTTATLLYRMFYPNCGIVQQMVFSDIMPALQQGKADFGVCIHEGRFTWQASGLFCVCDLGGQWEDLTGLPLPLGGILASRDLPQDTIRRVTQVIHSSIEYGLTHPDETMPTMRQFAQEMNDDVLMAHVDLYVNQHTIDLGSTGLSALQELDRRARQAGVVPTSGARLEVF